MTRVGSDHSPIILNTGEQEPPRASYFRFENHWLMQDSFKDMIIAKWQESKNRRPEHLYPLDGWHGSLCYVRQHLKGWNRQQIGEQKKRKLAIIQDIEGIDREAEIRGMSTEEWAQRYNLEANLERIYQMEEIYWKQRVGIRWMVKGDSNSGFFHQYANGRRRKSIILSLDTDQGEVRGQEDIEAHIVGFYKQLFGPNPDRQIHLARDFWVGHRQLSNEGRDPLTKPFSEAEVKEAIFDMKSDSAPGPNGFGVGFFKNFWEEIKGD